MRAYFGFLVTLTAGALLFSPLSATARDWPQAPANPPASSNCSANHSDNLVNYAESRDQRLANGSTNYIAPGANGSIRVHGWNNPDVLVRACIQTAASSDAEARALASQIAITKAPGTIEPTGPSTSDNQYWNVSYEVWVPKAANLDLKANNGSIAVENVQAQIRFHTSNGSVRLNEVAGDVEGSTTNGSVSIDLSGTGGVVNKLSAETTNGSVRLNLPENYSAQVEASTVNGKVHVDFPVSVSGEIGKTVSFQLGNGGPLIQAKTVNGSVHIGRKA